MDLGQNDRHPTQDDRQDSNSNDRRDMLAKYGRTCKSTYDERHPDYARTDA
jgi:hypothetical protein